MWLALTSFVYAFGLSCVDSLCLGCLLSGYLRHLWFWVSQITVVLFLWVVLFFFCAGRVHVSASFVHVYIWFASFSGSSFLFIKFLTFEQKKKNHVWNLEGWSSTSQTLSLLPKCHQFESHKSQGHWRLTWSLTSGLVRLVEVRASRPKHLH